MGMQSGMLLSVAASEVCTLQRRKMRQSAICCSAESSHHIPRNGIVSEQSTPFQSNVHAYMLACFIIASAINQRVNESTAQSCVIQRATSQRRRCCALSQQTTSQQRCQLCTSPLLRDASSHLCPIMLEQ